MGEWCRPVNPMVVSSPFGPRPAPNGPLHPGIDLRAPLGWPVMAVAAGKVVDSRLSPNDPDWWRWGMKRPADWPAKTPWPRVMGYGNLIKISHEDGTITVYAHLAKRSVAVGDLVVAGQVIGEAGSTGFSSGPHLHFEVRTEGGRALVDPMTRLPRKDHAP